MDRSLLHASIIRNISLSFARSGGAGGQNVNKVNTKVHASVPLDLLDGLSSDEKQRLRGKLAVCINRDDCVFIDVQDERFQERNREIALVRLEAKICAALRTNKKRLRTKPSKASVERRLKLKKIKSGVKRSRSKIF